MGSGFVVLLLLMALFVFVVVCLLPHLCLWWCCLRRWSRVRAPQAFQSEVMALERLRLSGSFPSVPRMYEVCVCRKKHVDYAPSRWSVVDRTCGGVASVQVLEDVDNVYIVRDSVPGCTLQDLVTGESGGWGVAVVVVVRRVALPGA